MNFSGVLVGAGAFLIIGLLHPVVIKAEYYFGKRIWPFFLLIGIACIALSVLFHSTILSALVAVLGFSMLWSIRELHEQEARVKKGWFPQNPNKESDIAIKDNL